VAWASIFVRPAPAVRTGLANKSDFNVDWALNSIFTWALVICILVMSSSGEVGIGRANGDSSTGFAAWWHLASDRGGDVMRIEQGRIAHRFTRLEVAGFGCAGGERCSPVEGLEAARSSGRKGDASINMRQHGCGLSRRHGGVLHGRCAMGMQGQRRRPEVARTAAAAEKNACGRTAQINSAQVRQPFP
jgi:hypothetical protein